MPDAALAGRRVIVTGAGRGLGRAIATACATRGAVVGVNWHKSEAEAVSVAREIGEGAMLLPFDVCDAAAVSAGIDAFIARYGGLDALVNNAGIIRPSLLVTATDEDIDAVVRTNLVGTITCTRAAVIAMLRARSGVVVNVGSMAAARPARGQTVYAASKGAIEAFTRAVAVEYARKGIRCEYIAPGPVDTSMFTATKAIAGEALPSLLPGGGFVSAGEVADHVVRLIAGTGAGAPA